ncbi:DinB family protein [Streptomyces sp. NBC_00820]|uniref:DinB family protein n=1 Tax=Streptomyces sp. NBC_00820 TaxID=2975842 RepID=UPI002ED30FF3|nr:DinB family protein [Streptomyces sp. NBC_00820]
MTITREEPATDAGERAMLEGWLDYHRQTLITKCEGLTDPQLRTASVEPSGLTLLGLVRHLTEVERYWFHEVLLGEDQGLLYSSEEDPDGDFRVTESDTWQETYATWQTEVAAARRDAAAFALDDFSKGLSRRTGRPFNLRWIYTHMIEEYARHNGHADLVRERIDGSTGD